MIKYFNILHESVSPERVNSAINNKNRILINYDDEKYHATGTRLVEPYDYGYTKSGNLAFRGFQYEGDTVRGIPKWKLFRLDRVINFKETDQKFNMQPKDNGWKAEEYNPNGDGSLINVLNQVNFNNDNDNEYYSPDNRLNILRKRTDVIKNSNPINISQINNTPNNSGPINNNVTKSMSTDNKSEFQKMLDRNLAITAKEKAKRGFSLNNKKDSLNRGPIMNNELEKDETDNQSNIISNSDNDNNTVDNTKDNNKSEFQKMLDRNLAITAKEKAKRGFSLNNKK